MINSLKEKAVSFLQMIASGDVREAYRRYTGTDFRHHNPFFRADPDSLLLAMEENAIKNPDKVFEVKRVIGEGNMVAVHSHVKQNQGDLGGAVVHIFRFHNALIVEFWDVGQPYRRIPPMRMACFDVGFCEMIFLKLNLSFNHYFLILNLSLNNFG